MRTSPHLFEETTLHPSADLSCDPPWAGLDDESADWSSDPMDQLMAKQEYERSELARWLAGSAH